MVDERAEIGSEQQDVVDLANEVARGRMVGDRPEHLGELEPRADRDERDRVGAGRTGAHRTGQLAVHVDEVAAVHGESAAAAKASTAVA